MIESTWINGLIKDTVVNNGIIQSKNYLLTEAYSRLIVPLNSYKFDTSWGSQLPLWVNTRTPINSNTVTSEVIRALQPMKDSRRILDVTVQIMLLSLMSISLKIIITDLDNKTYQLDTNFTGNLT